MGFLRWPASDFVKVSLLDDGSVGVFQTVLDFVLLCSPVIGFVCCFQVFSGVGGGHSEMVPRPSSYFSTVEIAPEHFSQTPGFVSFFQPGCWEQALSSVLLSSILLSLWGVLLWSVSSFCPSLLRSLLSYKMCAVYFQICRQPPRNSSTQAKEI